MLFSQPDFTIQPTGHDAVDHDIVLCFQQGKLLLTKEKELPTVRQFLPLLRGNVQLFELLRTAEHGYYTLPPYGGTVVEATEDFCFEGIRYCRGMPNEKAALVMSGWHLWSWYENNRFCGRCGHEAQPCETERAIRCPECGYLHFPMIAPAIIVAITYGDRILLARNARSAYPHFALIAGYVEVGETLEHALRREVMEEVGLELKEVRYLEDQPWGMSGSHMFAFHAIAKPGQTIRIQESELTEARWFDRSELSPKGSSFSIASELIERFRLDIL